MREIVGDVFTWSRLSEPHGYDFNGYLVHTPAGSVCIDPVAPDPTDLAELVQRGVTTIVLTNRNHVRASNAVRAACGARVAIHPDDAAHARGQGAEIDGELHGGSRVGPLVAVAVPGKSPGELALHWPERRILFVGDAVIGNPPGHCSLLRDRVLDDPARLRASVETLLALDFDVLLTGDGAPILSGAHDRLAELVASFPAS
ncbi:MAG: MBL fold metallo-hydrolase [Deltaproteobacteria bacterium]|nr:MBL fold metallo-hydrolase [Deltaproteobacteria bacterium]